MAISQRLRRIRLGVIAPTVFAATTLLITASPVAADSAPYFLKNIKAGSGSSSPSEFLALGDVVIFAATGGGAGRELWRSDGTGAGTYRILDIRPGSHGSEPEGLVLIGGSIFFSANDGAHGSELWVTNGTGAGTHMVKDATPGAIGTVFGASDDPVAIDVGGVAYFASANRLWRSDGTEAGTFEVPGTPDFVDNLVAFHGRAYFTAGGYLWRSDGTSLGTKRIKGSNGLFVKQPAEMLATDDYLFFEYAETKLWRTDGTPSGTIKILDLGPGCTYNCAPWMMLTRAGNLVFFTPDASSFTVWRSDGSVDGTFGLLSLNEWSSDMLSAVGDQMYIMSSPGLYVSDGTVDGTDLVDLPAGIHVYYVFDVAGQPFYGALPDGETATRLYKTDGTAAGTVLVGPPSPLSPIDLTVAGDHVYFRARDGRGIEPWAMSL